MCLAVPMKLTERVDFEGTVELDGVSRRISLMLEPDAAIGEYVLVHAGYAIGRVDREEAEKTLALLEETARAVEERERG